ncbi:potassium channel family protein [Actinocorallia sp. B10E7]|uniref:potassium channel family protein n=1 Tax=Actinocorallia sp. B10E7 TaxID=3153558 RepID=UPI00325C4E1D
MTLRRLRSWAGMVLSTVGFGILYFSVPMTRKDLSGGTPAVRALVLLAALGLIALVLVVQARRSLGEDRLMIERFAPLLGVVNLVVLFFSLIYYGNAGSFSGLETKMDSLYFTVSTLCTVGYGDITPISQGARAVVTVQMVFDLVIVTSAISFIVSAWKPRGG